MAFDLKDGGSSLPARFRDEIRMPPVEAIDLFLLVYLSVYKVYFKGSQANHHYSIYVCVQMKLASYVAPVVYRLDYYRLYWSLGIHHLSESDSISRDSRNWPSC